MNAQLLKPGTKVIITGGNFASSLPRTVVRVDESFGYAGDSELRSIGYVVTVLIAGVHRPIGSFWVSPA